MIVIRIKGGLGNQLFQYAAGYALAKETGQELALNPSFTSNMTPRGYKLLDLNAQYSNVVNDKSLPSKVRILKNKYVNKACRVAKGSEIYKLSNGIYFLEKNESFQPGVMKLNAENIYLDGYFQSEKYFKKYREELQQQIVPDYEIEEEYQKNLNGIKSTNSVAVHVRHGDFKKDNNPFHYVLGEAYYRNALNYLYEHVENPTFYWFSDDIEWVKDKFGNQDNFIFVSMKTKHADIDEMMLMKNCKHIITANSTFSWWAAWLNQSDEAIRIVPDRVYGNKDMIPENWVLQNAE